jgi:nucleotide-binding universal stress UspA family protein
MARAFNSEVLLLSVPEDLESPSQLDFIHRYLESVAGTLNGQGLRAKYIVSGTDPTTQIVEVAKSEAANMIMIATHGRGGLDRLMLGSVADSVIKEAQCPIFVVPVHKRR